MSDSWFKNKFLPSYLFFRDSLAEGRYKKEKDKSKSGRAIARELPDSFETDKKNTVLFITNIASDGVNQHVEYMANRLEEEGTRALIMRYDPSQKSMLLSRQSINDEDTEKFRFPSKYSELFLTLKRMKIKRVLVHHTQYIPYYFLKQIPSFVRALGAEFEYYVHDFLSICPRLYLVDGSEKYCGEPVVKQCNACVKKNGRFTSSPKDVGEWRKTSTKLLKEAAKIVAPSDDAAKRIKRHFPKVSVKTLSHPEEPPKITPQKIKRREGEFLRVAVIGEINQHKGADILLACVKDADERELPIEFRIIGSTPYDAELEEYENVHEVTGHYEDKDLPRHFREQLCHIAFFPNVCPETYSFTFTRAILGCLFPVAFNMGAIAERIKKIEWGEILPVDIMENAGAINDRLLEMKITPKPDIPTENIVAEYDNLLLDYYEN